MDETEILDVENAERLMDEEPSAPVEFVEVVETPAPRLLLSTPLDDYTVTEGLLLILVLLALCMGLVKLFREVF